MQIVIGVVIGLFWGSLVAWLNYGINKKAIAKNSSSALMLANTARGLIDLAALGLVFLFRKHLPGAYEATLCGTAASLGLLTVYFAFRLSKPLRSENQKQNAESGETKQQEEVGP